MWKAVVATPGEVREIVMASESDWEINVETGVLRIRCHTGDQMLWSSHFWNSISVVKVGK